MVSSRFALSILLVALLTACGFVWKERTRYAAVSVNCPTGTGSCFVDAAFNSLQSCEFYNEIGNMGCVFSPDRKSVTCHKAIAPLALGHCEVR